jgi:site-specific recombinase XerC
MSATKAVLDRFKEWLVDEQGLAATTATMYRQDAKTAAESSFKERLRDDDLAPKTRRRILSAGRQWAQFNGDNDLASELDAARKRLPPARRKLAKTPVTRDLLFAIVDEIDQANYLKAPMRAVQGMLACRGFRVSDVLRMRRDEIVAAKETGLLVFVAKGNRRLEFGVTKTWVRHLDVFVGLPADWMRVEDLISPTAKVENRRKAAVRFVERTLRKIGSLCGAPKLYPHQLRRTYAVEYLKQQKGDPEALLNLTKHMQWADESTALQYVNHVRGRELDEIAERIFER